MPRPWAGPSAFAPWKCRPTALIPVVTLVNALPEVAHNYERAHRLNLWFVLATERPEAIDSAADRIERETGLKVLRFPKEREFFIGFRVAV
jgi:hypothetical protein